MATLQNFDAEIAKTKQVVEEMRSKIEQSGTVLDKIAKTDAKIGDADFDIENARIEDVIKQQKVMEGNIADLIIGLEDATNVFGTEFESMKSFTGWEKLRRHLLGSSPSSACAPSACATCRWPAICRNCCPSPTRSSAS